jgi:hypothetical protein
MKMRFAPVAAAATAIMLLSACGDDDDSSTTTTEAPLEGATNLAKGEDVELVGDFDLGGQTLNVNAEEEDGEVTGEIRVSDEDGDVVVEVECADTDTDGVVILGGTVKDPAADGPSGLIALFIREGDPDSVATWADEGENPSCSALLENRRDVLDDESAFFDVEAGSDIETG